MRLARSALLLCGGAKFTTNTQLKFINTSQHVNRKLKVSSMGNCEEQKVLKKPDVEPEPLTRRARREKEFNANTMAQKLLGNEVGKCSRPKQTKTSLSLKPGTKPPTGKEAKTAEAKPALGEAIMTEHEAMIAASRAAAATPAPNHPCPVNPVCSAGGNCRSRGTGMSSSPIREQSDCGDSSAQSKTAPTTKKTRGGGSLCPSQQSGKCSMKALTEDSAGQETYVRGDLPKLTRQTSELLNDLWKPVNLDEEVISVNANMKPKRKMNREQCKPSAMRNKLKKALELSGLTNIANKACKKLGELQDEILLLKESKLLNMSDDGCRSKLICNENWKLASDDAPHLRGLAKRDDKSGGQQSGGKKGGDKDGADDDDDCDDIKPASRPPKTCPPVTCPPVTCKPVCPKPKRKKTTCDLPPEKPQEERTFCKLPHVPKSSCTITRKSICRPKNGQLKPRKPVCSPRPPIRVGVTHETCKMVEVCPKEATSLKPECDKKADQGDEVEERTERVLNCMDGLQRRDCNGDVAEFAQCRNTEYFLHTKWSHYDYIICLRPRRRSQPSNKRKKIC